MKEGIQEIFGKLSNKDLESFSKMLEQKGWLIYSAVQAAAEEMAKELTLSASSQQEVWDRQNQLKGIRYVIDLRTQILNRGESNVRQDEGTEGEGGEGEEGGEGKKKEKREEKKRKRRGEKKK